LTSASRAAGNGGDLAIELARVARTVTVLAEDARAFEGTAEHVKRRG
jgi:hypothetical protein